MHPPSCMSFPSSLPHAAMQSVKDVLQSLVDDGLVDSDRIGTSNYFWAFPSKALNNVDGVFTEALVIMVCCCICRVRGSWKISMKSYDRPQPRRQHYMSTWQQLKLAGRIQ